MKIEILGMGCAKCMELEKRAKEAARKAGIRAKVEHIYDIEKIVERGVIATPAMVVDGKVVVAGHLPSVDELVSILTGKK